MPIVLDSDDERGDWNRPVSLTAGLITLLIIVVFLAGACGWGLHAYMTGGR